MVLGKEYRRIFIILADIFIFALSFFLSFLIRFDGDIPFLEFHLCVRLLPFVILFGFLSFILFGIYKGIWRYASINDLINIVKAVASSSVFFVVFVVVVYGLRGFPRSVFIINPLITIFLIGGSRFMFRIVREITPPKSKAFSKNILIVGAGDAGDMVLREIKNNPKFNYNVIGLIDDDKFKQKMSIQGISVIGTRKDIVDICRKKNISEIIIAIPSANRQQMKLVVDECEKTSAELKTIPAIGDLIGGSISFSQIRDVEIEDLLGREVVEVDIESIREYLSEKRVLVTGAGGSIGSEICRKILKYARVKSIVLFGRGEHSIYEIYNELTAKYEKVELFRVIGDVINKKKVEGVFKKYRPEIVFHAGADKHVPLLELNPDEAILNNIIGTKNILEVAEEFKVEKVVCISTDKAADPVSVMGCTKRIAEMLIQGRRNAVTRSMGVRFGNVLGSRGSVIPLFKEQIRNGGPVTVTHPEMIRYFMTIPEAARLVLQAGALGQGGEIFLLDMGNPVKIVDLARQMIRLSGFEPDADIPVKFVGLRPGEKLEESLTGKDEKLKRTSHPKILAIDFSGSKSEHSEKDFGELKELAINMDTKGIIKKLKEMLPNYKESGVRLH